MSVTLNFHVCHQNITRADSCILVADSLNYAYAHFDFCSSDWDGLIKTAVFTRGQDTYEQILEDDQCLIPWEVLQEGKNIFTVSVFAGNRITTNTVKVKLDVSGWSFALESSQPPTEGVYSQILTRLADVEDTVVESAESAAQSAASATESAQSAEQSMEAARTAKSAAEEAAASVTQYSKTSESWAVGGTGTRTGEDTDNSKYYAEQAGAASRTAVSAGNAATGAAQAATQAAGSASQSAQIAAEGAQTVQELYDGAVSDIAAAKTAAVGAIQTKGDQVLDSIPEDYSDLSGDVTALKADLSDKDALTVGTAKQLVGNKFTEDKAPYLFRQSGGGLSVGNRKYLDAVVGGTMVWNQLSDNYEFKETQSVTKNGVTCTYTESNTFTLSGTATAAISFYLSRDLAVIPAGHKVLVTGLPRSFNSNTEMFINLYNKRGSNAFYRNAVLSVIEGTNGLTDIAIFIRSGFNTDGIVVKPQTHDLTAMFGTEIADHIYALEQANAGDGVALFKKLFTEDYYAYNPGELISVSGVSVHETVGFNQWDEEWIYENSRIKPQNFMPVFPDTTYYRKSPNNILPIFYDSKYTQIASGTWGTGTFTTPTGCAFIKFHVDPVYGATYKNDICINIFDPKRNGTYEPYTKHSYPLDSTLTLRGVPKLVDGKVQFDGDRYLPDGTVQRRYGVVVLDGNTNIETGASGMPLRFQLANKKRPAYNELPSAISDKLQAVIQGSTWGIPYTFSFVTNSDTVFLKLSDNITTVADAKTYLASNPITIVYELATPTIETATPYRSDQLLNAGGTEEFVSTGIVPVGHETRYPEDLVKKLESLPWDMSMIAPVETGTTAGQAYAVGKYFILNDQFCKAKTSIASGATFTLNTNYEVTTVADELYTALH